MPGQKLSLQQKLLQKLSPQQIQMIKLLELPTLQLEQRIQKEIEENPVLEIDNNKDSSTDNNDSGTESEGDVTESKEAEISIDEYINDEPSYKYRVNNYSKDDKKEEIPFSIGTTFHEFLIEQLGLLKLDDTEMKLAEYIIGNIDEDGYLRRDIEAMVDDIAFAANIEVTDQKMEEMLLVVQDLDPVGIGARNLRECLLLQLKKKQNQTETVINATRLIDETFDEFTKKHYEKIMAKLGLSEDKLREAVDEIVKLNPKPGGSYSSPLNKENQTITPDFILENNNGELTISLTNSNIPDLKISRHYADMLRTYNENRHKPTREQREAVVFVKQKLDSAKWFIDAIKQRHQTLLVTMNAILEYQKEFFADGDETKLKPMVLKDIAKETGLDISTISRVSNSKYIQTHFGIYPLKYFFSESMQDESGEEVSTRKIKKILQDVVDAENKRRPVTDDQLAEILKSKGFPIARRTVAKYREQLNIPVARMRKELV